MKGAFEVIFDFVVVPRADFLWPTVITGAIFATVLTLALAGTILTGAFGRTILTGAFTCDVIR